MVGVYVAQDGKGAARVAVTGAGPGVFRQAEMEAALSKSFKADALAGIAVKPRGLNSDIHGSAAYRAHLISVMARRALAAAK
jgi:carbon-monoxide dehydrogenase medium subunit